jgi:hypothetical protein
MRQRTYRILASLSQRQGGWTLELIENATIVIKDRFPIYDPSVFDGIKWWASLEEVDQVKWRLMACSAQILSARHAFLLAEAYKEASNIGKVWIS